MGGQHYDLRLADLLELMLMEDRLDLDDVVSVLLQVLQPNGRDVLEKGKRPMSTVTVLIH